MKALEDFRSKYDALSDKIEAHITVVFPTDSLLAGLSACEAIDCLLVKKEINISFGKRMVYHGSIGYLEIVEGREEVDSIYRFFSRKLNIVSSVEFVPHVTVVRDGKIRPPELDLGVNSFRISKVVLERIGMNEESICEYKRRL